LLEPFLLEKKEVKTRLMTAETDYSSMIKDFLSQNNINLGTKSLEQFLGEISNLQNLQPGAGHIQVGDFRIVKAITGEISIVDNRIQTDSVVGQGDQVAEQSMLDQGQYSQVQEQQQHQQQQSVTDPSADQSVTDSQNGDDDDKPSKKKKKKDKKKKKKEAPQRR